jgi:hypothetical protein
MEEKLYNSVGLEIILFLIDALLKTASPLIEHPPKYGRLNCHQNLVSGCSQCPLIREELAFERFLQMAKKPEVTGSEIWAVWGIR